MGTSIEDWVDFLPAEIRAVGVPIDSPGPFETAWPLSIANALGDWFRENEFGIVGGDIFSREAKRFVHTHDGWGCDIELKEKWTAYSVRSAAVMLSTLGAVSNQPDLWFTVVATNRPDARQLARSYAR